MRENKGFTLIELLAVIVILAIIALIATPVIMNIINSSRKSAAQESAKLMISELRLAYNEASLEAQSAGTDLPTTAAVFAKFSADGVNVESNKVKDSFNTSCEFDTNGYITCTSSSYNLKDNSNTLSSKETFQFAS